MKSKFCGRHAEMAALLDAFESVSAPSPQPQLVLLLAESGLGKTRLVQEFYNWLSTNMDGVGGDGYWPDSLDQEGDNLKINPDLSKCDNSKPLPFLWWGLRLANPAGRNQAATTAVIEGLTALTPHLEPLQTAKRRKERLLAASKSTGGVFLDFAAGSIPFFGAVKTLTSYAVEMAQHIRDTIAEHERHDISAIHTKKQKSVANALIEDLTALLGEQYEGRVPAIIAIDDAQFSSSDSDLVEVVEALLDAAFSNKWPLLVIVTHWESEWQTHKEIANQKSVANAISKFRDHLPVDWEPLRLERLDDLGPMLETELPGLTADQREALLSRADGNPRFLDEIIRCAKEHARYFEGRQITNALTSEGLSTLLSKATNLRDLVRTRMKNAPRVVQQAIAIGSVQGASFLKDVVDEIGTVLGTTGAGELLQQAERPHAFVRGTDTPVVNFSQGVFHEVAREILEDEFDSGQVEAALVGALTRRIQRNDIWNSLTDAERSHALLLAPAFVATDTIDADLLLRRIGGEAGRLLASGLPSAAAEIAGVGLNIVETVGIPPIADGLKQVRPLTVDLLVIGKALRVGSRHEEARRLLDALIATLEDQKTQVGTGWSSYSQNELGTVYMNRAYIQRALGNREQTVVDLGTAITIHEGVKAQLETRTGKPWVPKFETTLACNYIYRADVRRSLGDFSGAMADCETSIARQERLKVRMGADWTADYERNLAEAYESRAMVWASLHEVTEALEDFNTVATRLEALKRWPNTQWKPNSEFKLASVYYDRGFMRGASGDFAGALEDFQTAITLRKSLRSRFRADWTPGMECALADCYVKSGYARSGSGDAAGAKEDYATATALYDALKRQLGKDWTPDMECALEECYVDIRGVA